MPAINNAIVARDTYSTIAKRNWASEEPGVVCQSLPVGWMLNADLGVLLVNGSLKLHIFAFDKHLDLVRYKGLLTVL